MFYYFVINGRADIRPKVDKLLDEQLPSLGLEYKKYYTMDVGDGTRAVRLYSDLHQRDEVCFVACGGSGIANEVASGIVGFELKSMAILAFGDTNDVIKYYPGLDFQDLRKVVNGRPVQVDLIKAGDSYCLNVINFGFDAMVAYNSVRYMERGLSAVKAYRWGVLSSVMVQRVQHIKVKVDGKLLNRHVMMSGTISNARVCGGQFICAPRALNDDGLADVLVMRPMSLWEFAVVLKNFTKGTHLESGFCQRRQKYCQTSHLELDSKNLIYLCIDGEFVASTHFDVDVLPRAINLILPQQ